MMLVKSASNTMIVTGTPRSQRIPALTMFVPAEWFVWIVNSPGDVPVPVHDENSFILGL